MGENNRMSKYNIHFQSAFSKSSKIKLCREFSIAPEDDILLAAWISDTERSVFQRKGFIITKTGICWCYPAIVESSERGDENKEKTPRNQNFIEKNNVTFLGTDVRSPEVAARIDGKSEIQLRISGNLYTFAFDSGIKQEKLIALERAIAGHFSDCIEMSAYEKIDESYSLAMTLLSIGDFFSEYGRIVKEKFAAFKFHLNKGAKKIQSVETKNKAFSAVNKIGAFFRHIIDFSTDLMLMFAILIFAKPQLLIRDFLQGVSAKISGLSVSIFYFDYTKEITEEIIDKRNFIFIVLVGLFLILKVFISLSCRKNRKAVTALLLIMLIANFLLITDKFFVFTIFLFLLLLAMQFSMGFSGKTIGRKSMIFICTCIIGYLVLHIVLYEDFTEILRAFFETLSLPVKWW